MQVIRIERHDVRRRTMFLPAPLTKPELWPAERLALLTPVYKGETLVGYEGTTLSNIEWGERQGYVNPVGRMDIVLINEKVECECKDCGHKHHRTEQHAVYPSRGGSLRGAVHLLSEEDREWALQESRKCWEEPRLRPYCK